MRVLTAAEVLSVWEAARGRQALRLALECLARATPRSSPEEWAGLPFGRVCQALFQLRALMFGPEMPGVVGCPQCGERLEFQFECSQIAMSGGDSAGTLRIDAGERPIEFRLPTAGDLLEAQTGADLLRRCAAEPVEPAPALVAAVSAAVADADPLCETTLHLTCPACGHAWQALLDIVAYFSQEITHEARRLLGEVHRLASAYGWSEAEILALSAARRQIYLELAGA